MSVLVDHQIIDAIQKREIVIEPFEDRRLGTNSYDVRLADTLRVYEREFEHVRTIDGNVFVGDEMPLDTRAPRATKEIKISEAGYVLHPGELYLASTVEYTESNEHLPILNGKSSLGRLGLSIHVTAGTGDVGFKGHWTMELFVVKPLRIYAGMAIGQLLWFEAARPLVPYHAKSHAKYRDQQASPQASRMHDEHARLDGGG